LVTTAEAWPASTSATACRIEAIARLRGHCVASRNDGQRIGKRCGGVCRRCVGQRNIITQQLRAGGEEGAVSEQIERRKVQLLAAEPGAQRDVRPDAGRFAQCQREG
jgi:hypothetical protein